MIQYSVHLMFGGNFLLPVKKLKKYILKYGEGNISSYIDTLLWENKPEGEIAISSVEIREAKEDDPFVSGIDDLFGVTLHEQSIFPVKEQTKYIASFFDKLFYDSITINNTEVDKQMQIYLHIPLYDDNVWREAEGLIKILSELDVLYNIHIIGFASDMAPLFTSEEELKDLPLKRIQYKESTADILSKIVKYKQERRIVSNVFVMQNSQREGISLQLDIDSFTKTIGEFTLLAVNHYPNLTNTIELNKPIKAFGLSILNFDKYYFVQYLLKKAYLYLLEKEGVTDTKVSLVEAANIAQEKLKDKINLVNKFYKEEVQPLLIKNINHDNIIVQITPKLDQLFDNINDDLQSFLSDDSLSIPEKRATMAVLLGLDDPILSGYAFNQSQLILDDIDAEAATMFINVNNDLLDSHDPSKAILSQNGKKVEFPIETIKQIRTQMREATTYIRDKEDQLLKIDTRKEEADEAEKRLTSDGFFVYEGNRFRLIPKGVQEKALTETYIPLSDVSQLASSIDLRDNFTAVKNQGTLGACTAFTCVSIYEYILKANKALDSNLSEAFLYYNARKQVNKQDEDVGSNFYDSISSLMANGVCEEYYFPYDGITYNIEPSPEAYQDAATKLVKKALNVDCDKYAICSALSQGYPVAISLKLYDSFSTDRTGFVSRPTSEEIKSNKYGNHAMVICGFSDDQKVFIVRNSWGNDFGDNGYCYIPYSYIEDKSLLNMACIITELGADYKVSVNSSKAQLYFDTTDANIQYAITKNLVEEERYRLHKLTIIDNILRERYFFIIEKLRKNNVRTQLIDAKKESLENQIENFKKIKAERIEDKQVKLKVFDKVTRKTGLRIILAVVAIWAILISVFYSLKISEILSAKESWYTFICSVVLIGFAFLYFPHRKRKRKVLVLELDEEIIYYGVQADKCVQELSSIRLRLHITGMFLDRFFGLQDRLINKFHVMQSFSGNLLTWYKEEKSTIKEMSSDTKQPFISLISNDILDKYFEENSASIVQNMKLSDFINTYSIKEEDISKFKKQLKKNIENRLFSIIRDFRIYDYFLGEKKYSYLDNQYANYANLLPILDKKSEVFLHLLPNASREIPHKVIFIKTDKKDEETKWREVYPISFNLYTAPISENLESSYKIIVLRVMNLEPSQIMVAMKE